MRKAISGQPSAISKRNGSVPAKIGEISEFQALGLSEVVGLTTSHGRLVVGDEPPTTPESTTLSEVVAAVAAFMAVTATSATIFPWLASTLALWQLAFLSHQVA